MDGWHLIKMWFYDYRFKNPDSIPGSFIIAKNSPEIWTNCKYWTLKWNRNQKVLKGLNPELAGNPGFLTLVTSVK